MGFENKALHAPAWSDPRVELSHESIELSCEQTSRHAMVCRWDSVHVYRIPKPVDALYGLVLEPEAQAGATQVWVDGVEQTPRSLQAEDCWAWTPALDDACDEDPPPVQSAHALVVDPDHSEVEIHIETAYAFSIAGFCGCNPSGGETRHPLVGRTEEWNAVTVLRSPGAVAEDATTRAQVHAPRKWAGGRRNVAGADEASERARQFYGVEIHTESVDHGPALAAGVGFGDRGFGVRPQLRAGYEVFGPVFGGSLVAESDLREHLVLAPLVEACSPGAMFIFPSFGGGLGVPVMLLPEARPGFRVQLTIAWIAVSLVGVFDVYPGGNGWDQQLRGAALVQVSL